MNKKACRVSAPAYPPLDPRHGLLHAAQVDYIVRTAVKNIDRHRTLVLYVYDREQAAGGNRAPVWTVFQGRGDYITLARREDGTTAWRTAAFERLGDEYNFVNQCAFWSAADRDRVTRFFHDGQREGLDALTHAQSEILEQRLRQRLRERERAVLRRMEHLPALPRNLGRWLRREVVPAYFIYDHAKKGEAAGVCTACGREITLTGVKHNASGVCPRCGREVTMKPRGRIGRLQDWVTCQVVQRTRSGELVVRIIKAIADISEIKIWENARQFLRLDPEGEAVWDAYYETTDGHWKQGERPVFYPYSYNFFADTCGHVYTANLPGVLAGTPWQYCPVQLYYEHFHQPMELAPFLAAHLKHPKLEHLCKVGFFSLASDLASDLAYCGRYEITLDEAQDRTHRLLGVGAEDVPFLRELDIDLSTLGAYQEYCRRNLKDRQRLLRWQLEHEVKRDLAPALEYMTVHKLIRYLEEQYAGQQESGARNGMQYLVTEYRDYLDMCGKLGCDMNSSFTLYPADLRQAHDRAATRLKQKADAKLRREFKLAYQRIFRHLDYEYDGMKFLLPATPEELAAEGSALHHCVGSYADRVARKECLILFLRQCENEDKPFYTVEVRNGEVAQVRGMGNCDPTPEVARFMERWERQVLRDGALEAAA